MNSEQKKRFEMLKDRHSKAGIRRHRHRDRIKPVEHPESEWSVLQCCHSEWDELEPCENRITDKSGAGTIERLLRIAKDHQGWTGSIRYPRCPEHSIEKLYSNK